VRTLAATQPGRALGRRAALALLACTLLAGPQARAKPLPPVTLKPRITRTDRVAGTAEVVVSVHAAVEAAVTELAWDLPAGAVVVPGTGEWQKDQAGRRRYRVRVVLPPAGGKLVVRATVRGPKLRTAVVAGVTLPAGDPAKARPKTKPKIIKTSRGERLRLHK
jgi:hypothetical protein